MRIKRKCLIYCAYHSTCNIFHCSGKRLKTDGAMPSNTSDSEDEMNVAQRDNLSKSVLSWPSTSEADNVGVLQFSVIYRLFLLF